MQKYAYLLIFIIGFLVYFNTLFNGFVWDDEEQIVNNQIIHSLANTGQITSGATFSTGGAGLSGWFFRPFLTLTYMLNYQLWGENAWGYHLFQVIFHLINALLIYRILLLLTENSKTKSHTLNTLYIILATIYAVHPAINEAVVYISALSEVMLTFFILLGFYLLLKENMTFKKLLETSVLLLSASLYKESALVAFPILGAYLLIYKPQHYQKLGTMLGLTLLIYFFIRLGLAGTPIQHPEFSPISEAPLYQRLLTIPSELTHYLQLTVFPKNLAISQHWVVTSPYSPQFLIPLLVLIPIILTTFYLILKWKSKLIAFGLIWLLLGFGLVSNIFPLDMTIAERWFYFPFIGFILVLSGLLSPQNLAPKTPKLVTFYTIVFFVTIVALSVRTVVRNSNWVDGMTLYSHDAAINPDSFDLQNNLGVELFRAGKTPEAKVHFQKSIALQPKWHFAQNNLGAVYEREGNFEAAKAQYQKVLETSDYYLAHENLAQLLLFHESTESAKQSAENSLKKLPQNPRLWLTLAIAEYQLGKKDEALKAAQNSYYLEPTQKAAYVLNQIQNNQAIQFNTR